MSASDHLNGEQFDLYRDWDEITGTRDEPPEPDERAWNPPHLFHGTNADLEPGDVIEPGRAGNFAESRDRRHEHAYATSRLRSAADYADRVAGSRGGFPRVYEVADADDRTPDPEEGRGIGWDPVNPTSWRSRTGFRVVGRVPSGAARRAKGFWDNDYNPSKKEDRW